MIDFDEKARYLIEHGFYPEDTDRDELANRLKEKHEKTGQGKIMELPDGRKTDGKNVW